MPTASLELAFDFELALGSKRSLCHSEMDLNLPRWICQRNPTAILLWILNTRVLGQRPERARATSLRLKAGKPRMSQAHGFPAELLKSPAEFFYGRYSFKPIEPEV